MNKQVTKNIVATFTFVATVAVVVCIAVVGISTSSVSAQLYNPAGNGICTNTGTFLPDTQATTDGRPSDVASYGTARLTAVYSPGKVLKYDSTFSVGPTVIQTGAEVSAVEYDPSGSFYYAAGDFNANGSTEIVKFNATTNASVLVIGEGQIGTGYVSGMDVNNGRVVVGNDTPKMVKVFNTTTGALVTTLSAASSFTTVGGIAIDSAGNIYAIDGTTANQYNSSGVFQASIPGSVSDVEVDENNNVYASKPALGEVHKYSGSLTYLGKFGTISCGWKQKAPSPICVQGLVGGIDGSVSARWIDWEASPVQGPSPFIPVNYYKIAFSGEPVVAQGTDKTTVSVTYTCDQANSTSVMEVYACANTPGNPDNCDYCQATFIAQDNLNTCEGGTVLGRPQPVGINGVALEIGAGGTASVTAASLLRYPGEVLSLPNTEYKIGKTGDTLYSGATPATAVLNLTCADVDNYVIVEVHACNSNGCNYFRSYVQVYDNSGVCGGGSAVPRDRTLAYLQKYGDPYSTCVSPESYVQNYGELYGNLFIDYDWSANDMYVAMGNDKAGVNGDGTYPYGRVSSWDCGSATYTPPPSPSASPTATPPPTICLAKPGKVCICHYPPGEPENVQVIEVSSNAVKAHMKHGDDTFNELTQVCDVPVELSDSGSVGSYVAMAVAALAAGLGIGLYTRRKK